MRVHLCQLAPSYERPTDELRGGVDSLLRAQAGADLVVLPELWPQGGFTYQRWAAEAEPVDGPTLAMVSAAARAIGAHVHAGSIVERDADGRLYNTALLVGPDGGLLATYRKIHLFGFSAGEPALMTAGTDLVVADIGGLAVGLATCYDLRFPEMFRALLDRGAQAFVVPAAWPAPRVAHWRLLAQARAVEEQAYVVATNTAGVQAGLAMGGGSVVVDPWGVVVAEAGQDEQVLVADLDPALVTKTRAEFPVLADRRL
jgi:predicted amidohydrolase